MWNYIEIQNNKIENVKMGAILSYLFFVFSVLFNLITLEKYENFNSFHLPTTNNEVILRKYYFES